MLGDIKKKEKALTEKIQNYSDQVRKVNEEDPKMEQFEGIRSDEKAINKLKEEYSRCLREMELFANATGLANQRAIVARFRDVFSELNSNFRLISENASRKMTRMELFSGRNEEVNQEDMETQLLLKEMKATTNSVRMADSYLESALSSQSSLRQQNLRLKNNRNKMSFLGNRFPTIQRLTSNVNLRKVRDK